MFYGSGRIIRATVSRAFTATFIPEEKTGFTTVLVISCRRHLCVYFFISALLLSIFSMAHLQLSQQATKEKTVLDIAIIQISDTEGGKNVHLLFCFSGIIDRQVIVVTRLSPFECVSKLIYSVHCERSLLTEQPVGRRAEMKQQSSGCAFGGPGESERRQTSE